MLPTVGSVLAVRTTGYVPLSTLEISKASRTPLVRYTQRLTHYYPWILIQDLDCWIITRPTEIRDKRATVVLGSPKCIVTNWGRLSLIQWLYTVCEATNQDCATKQSLS